MYVSDYTGPNEMDLAFKLEGEGILPSQIVRERILLSPAVGAVLMSLSTVIVAINAQLLRKTIL